MSERLRITFVGPEVPEAVHGKVVFARERAGSSGDSVDRPSSSCLRHFRGHLSAFLSQASTLFPNLVAEKDSDQDSDRKRRRVQKTPRVDAFVGFNLGLTCDDYDWGPSLDALVISYIGVPLVLFTNTKEELKRERAVLLESHGVSLSQVACLVLVARTLLPELSLYAN